MSNWVSTALDSLDRSAKYVRYVPRWALGLVVATAVLVWLGVHKRVFNRVAGSSTLPSPSPSPSPSSVAYSRALYMARESAKLVAQALEDASHDVLQSYAGAVQANVLAQTAKDLVDDTTTLSKDLGVDIFEYLTYTSKVMTDVQKRLVSACTPPRSSSSRQRR